MSYKPLYFWIAAGLLLFICLFYSPFKQKVEQEHAIKLTSLLDTEPNRLYFLDSKFHLDLSGIKRLRLEVNLTEVDITQVHDLIIENFTQPLQVATTLHWQQGGKTLHKTINNNHTSITPLNLDQPTDDAINSGIEVMYLLVEVNPELGTSVGDVADYSFTNMYLGNQQAFKHQINTVAQWFSFQPLKFASINSYTSLDQSNSNSLILRLGCWLLLSGLLFLLIKPARTHVLIVFFLAWVIALLPYAYNHSKQHQQLINSIDPDTVLINQIDQQAWTVANTIESTLPLLNHDLSQQKLILVGDHDFYRLRIYKHLLKYNTALINIHAIAPENLTANNTFLLTGSLLSICQESNSFASLFDIKYVAYLDPTLCIINHHD